jgi:Transposase DDE domain group 1
MHRLTGGILRMGASSHTLDRVEVTFDGDRMVADAGLILPATLSQHLGVEALVDELVSVGHRPGRKLLTVVHALLAGGDCIDDADILRSGATSEVVGHEVMAPSTIGTWLRSFTFGHVRQLDALTERLLTAAWAAGAGPGAAPLVIDVDSTICQTHGYAKQGATYGYTRQRGYHPLLATRADTGEILHARMRKGSANSSRGAQRFVRETIRRVRRAGATGPIVLRADSAFWSAKVITACRDHNVRFSITVRATKAVVAAIDGIDETAWVDIDYTDGGVAQVAETTLAGRRLIVRRTRLVGAQAQLWPDWRHHAFITTLTATPSLSTPTTARTQWSSSPSATSRPAPG